MGRRIHVAIVSHGNASEVALLLGDLERHAANAEISVLLVVNQEEPLSFETHRFAFPLRIHRNQHPRGFGANNNLAFRLAAPSADEFFCIINPDVRIHHEVFEPLLACLEQEPAAALVAPLAKNRLGATEDNARALPRPATILRKALGKPDRSVIPDDKAQPVDWVAGLFMLFTARGYAAVGGFDERYFLYYEDVDLCARLWSAGMRVMQLRQVSVIHVARRSSHRSLRYLAIHLVSMSRYFLSGSFWGIVWRSAFQSGARRS